jgi:hypothetical protein
MSAQTTVDTPNDTSQGGDGLPNEALAIAAVVVALLAGLAAALIFNATGPDLHLDTQGFEVFAPIYFAAQAIERLLEPLSSYFNPTVVAKDDVKAARENKLAVQQAATVVVGSNPASAAEAVDVTATSADVVAVTGALANADKREQKAVNTLRNARANRKLIFFMIATVVSCILTGFLGLGVLEAMSTQKLSSGLGALDVALTGVVIGAGTGPLHDLVTRLQKAKENADPATKPTGQLPGTPGAVPPPPATPTQQPS